MTPHHRIEPVKDADSHGKTQEGRRFRMREKFEFASKVIGLVLVCLGIVTGSYMAHLIFFGGSEYNELLRIYREGGLNADRLTLNALFSAFQIEQKLHIKLLVICLLQIPVGMYLMRPNNFFVRWGVPMDRQPSSRKAEIISIKSGRSHAPDLPTYPLTKHSRPRK
ncbi:MAG: hypothetical protein ACOWWM_20290 [Desulfobacterales bacterium]